MTRRERIERKIERRRTWAASAETKSSQAFRVSQSLVENIPMGQPILVGHHSEGRHRRTLDRSWDALGKSVELSKKAEMHGSKAANLESALERTIFSDDTNAIEELQTRIEEREAERERMKAVNSLYRKADSVGLQSLGLSYETLKAQLLAAGPYFGKSPYMPFELQNIGGRIQADKKRLESIKRQQQRKVEAGETENGVKITKHSNSYSSITFAEKPERAILAALRGAGFRWGAGYWFGQTANIPECVGVLAGTAA